MHLTYRRVPKGGMRLFRNPLDPSERESMHKRTHTHTHTRQPTQSLVLFRTELEREGHLMEGGGQVSLKEERSPLLPHPLKPRQDCPPPPNVNHLAYQAQPTSGS